MLENKWSILKLTTENTACRLVLKDKGYTSGPSRRKEVKLSPIKTEKHYTIISQQIEDLIEAEHLQPGERLPSERELAQALSVSRTSVRQAISAIASKGLVRVKQGDGTFVAEPSDKMPKDIIVDSLGKSLASQQINPIEIAEARRLVESEAAKLCAKNADEDICRRLREIIVQSKSIDADKHYGFYELNVKLHRIIAEGADNTVYKIFMECFIELMHGNLWYWGKEHSPDHGKWREKNWKEHEELVEAICNHDPESAARIMYEHMSTVVMEMQGVFN